MNRKSMVVILTLAVISIIYVGCGDDSIEIIRSEGELTNPEVSGVASYFPLNEGYVSIYSVTTNNGAPEQVTFTVGEEIQLGTVTTKAWIGQDRFGYDTTYVYATNEALYFYSTILSSPERILELPLVIGHSWSRLENLTTGTEDIFVDIITGFDDKLVDTTGGHANKTVPTVGSVTMRVVDIGRVELSDGSLYDETIKVANLNNGKINYYWFTPGVGLVRYVIGSSDDEGVTGDIVGEMINFHN